MLLVSTRLPGDLPMPRADWALFLDLDGTLLDFAPRPDAVTVPASLAPALLAGASALSGALAVVSGRDIATLDALLHPARVPAAGSHGAELRIGAEAAVIRHAPPIPAALVAAAAAEAAARGLHLETKPVSLVLHYREAPERAAGAEAAMSRLAALAGPAYEILPAALALELRPRGFDKGRAVAALMATPPFAGRRPFFLGDDVTDRQGIAAARALGGDGALVGTDIAARPADVRAWLAALPALLGQA
jgi:trehalose 6-phosphate phosphatase